MLRMFLSMVRSLPVKVYVYIGIAILLFVSMYGLFYKRHDVMSTVSGYIHRAYDPAIKEQQDKEQKAQQNIDALIKQTDDAMKQYRAAKEEAKRHADNAEGWRREAETMRQHYIDTAVERAQLERELEQRPRITDTKKIYEELVKRGF